MAYGMSPQTKKPDAVESIERVALCTSDRQRRLRVCRHRDMHCARDPKGIDALIAQRPIDVL
jgi:hypothetical protein